MVKDEKCRNNQPYEKPKVSLKFFADDDILTTSGDGDIIIDDWQKTLGESFSSENLFP